jgi:hypothetical protein
MNYIVKELTIEETNLVIFIVIKITEEVFLPSGCNL